MLLCRRDYHPLLAVLYTTPYTDGSEAFAAAAVVATRTAPEISAAITAKMLIDLGLVAVEDD